MKIVTIIGARPQFVKAIALSSLIAKTPGVLELLVHTGQHFDDNMSDVFFRDLGLSKPNVRFNLGGGSHGQMTGRQLEAVEKVILAERPDVCLVYGDTNSTLAGAVAAAKLHVPVAHVEAGLRSFNRRMPEEINRVLTDHVSDWLFAPTHTAVKNLSAEGVASEKVYLTGDVMYDVARLILDNPNRRTDISDRMNLPEKGYTVATLHRQENTDDPARLVGILTALVDIAKTMPVVLPIHPRTRKMAASQPEAMAALGRLTIIEPLGFFDMATLLSGARLALTDSGGLQKEAFFFKVPCVTLRDETEWVELVEMGWNRLPKAITSGAIGEAVAEALVAPPGLDAKPFGCGNAAQRILAALKA